MSYAIEVKNLYFWYEEGFPVLKNINLMVEKGECVAIMGENGAGKTTLIKHFNGLFKPKKGLIKILGTDTRKTTVASLAKNVGIVFQNPDHQLFAETVYREVAFALENFNFPKDEIEARVNHILEFFDLYKYKDKSPFTLSEGERRRLAIASVVVYDPQILVFDEPTAGQDLLQKIRIADLIKKLVDKGKTIVVVTHDVEFAATIFDRIVILSHGQIIADGTPAEVLTNPEILGRARLTPPQIVKCVWLLSDVGIPRKITKIEELTEAIISLARGAGYVGRT